MALSQIKTGGIASNAITTAKIADSAITSAKLPAGSVLQYKTIKDTTRSTTTSSSWTDVTTLAMTPTDSTSKILMMVTGNIHANRDGDQLLALYRVGRVISGGSFVQLNSSSTAYDNTSDVHMHLRYIDHPAAAQLNEDIAVIVEDDHNTTSEITYKVQQNMQSSMANAALGGVNIVLMEIAT